MRVRIILTEANPDILWTHGEVLNVSIAGHPTVSLAEAMLKKGTVFLAQPGLQAYRFLIKGDGALRMQAFDADSNNALAPGVAFDTKEAHGGFTYVFSVS
jgi:hypothetical protein